MYQEFASYGVGQLKDYLSAKGLVCTGNKEQLAMVSRCFVAWETKVGLRVSEKERMATLKYEYMLRLTTAQIQDPRSIDEAKRSANVKEWPKMDLGKIFSFILSKREHDMEFVGNKAYSYYQSDFVDTIKTTLW